MVKIRLKRMGKKGQPFYRIVVANDLARRDGRFIEQIGYYDPIQDKLKIDENLTIKWLNNGAKPTETTRSLLKKLKITEKYAKQKTTRN